MVEVEGTHGGDVAGEGGRLLVGVVGAAARRGIGDRCHVDDDECAQQLRPAQRQLHGHLAAHRVPHQRGRWAERLELGRDQAGHVEVVDPVGPGRVPVVGQVQQRHAVPVGQAPGDGGPVLALAEQAVHEHHR
jgi:hypothetical protein